MPKRIIWGIVFLIGICAIVLLSHPLWCAHDFQPVNEIEATCKKSGTVYYECVLCYKEKEETTEPLGHDMRYDGVELEEVGESVYTRAIYVCERCGYKTAEKPEYCGSIPTTGSSTD